MKNHVKNIVVTLTISALFAVMFLACVLHKPVDISISERRQLAQFPTLTWADILDGKNIEEFAGI